MRSKLMLPFLCLFLAACASLEPKSANLETSVCGAVQEPFIFWIWSRSAGKVNPSLAQQVPNSEPLSYRTVDGRVLHGYKLRSSAQDGRVRGSVLLAQGNAMLAEHLLGEMAELSQAGLDVYIFDYRGYGQSEGKRRLKAIVSDYREMYENVLPKDRGKRLLYGISFGGIVLSNVIGSGIQFDAAVIDSSPSRLSNHGCEDKYDPVANIPQNASKITVIAGLRDTVIKPDDSHELRAAVEKQGGKSVFSPDFAHPFMDSSAQTRLARMALVKRHLLGEALP